jgi:hypothetical protein
VSDWAGLAWLVVLLAGNAFFVGAEFAVIAAKRSQIEPLAEAGSKRAKTSLYAMENATLMLATSQLGITVCSLLILLVSEPAVHHLLEGPWRPWDCRWPRSARWRSSCAAVCQLPARGARRNGAEKHFFLAARQSGLALGPTPGVCLQGHLPGDSLDERDRERNPPVDRCGAESRSHERLHAG